ncbi:MAG: hypothetical protein EBY38_07340 [Flavobacteriaceae bacterium]|nr:hypothetical protein [Flavobacteriaceae bacterium]
MGWDTSARFKTGSDWVKASLESRGFKKTLNDHDLDQFSELVGSICKKRKGVWSLLKSAPKDHRSLIWHAHKIGGHWGAWGNYAPWSDSVTAQLMDADDTTRENFDMVLQVSAIISKAIKGKKKWKH